MSCTCTRATCRVTIRESPHVRLEHEAINATDTAPLVNKYGSAQRAASVQQTGNPSIRPNIPVIKALVSRTRRAYSIPTLKQSPLCR